MNEEKWLKMSFGEQMGNIGSEVFRIIGREKAGDEKSKKDSLWRVLELIDLTIKDKKLKNKRPEVLRLREVLCDLFLNNNSYNTSVEYIKNYFIQLALINK